MQNLGGKQSVLWAIGKWRIQQFPIVKTNYKPYKRLLNVETQRTVVSRAFFFPLTFS